MEVTNADMDKVLNYVGERIDFGNDTTYAQDKNEMADMMIDLQIGFETLVAVLNKFELYNCIEKLIISDAGFSFLIGVNLYESWDEGGFAAMERVAQ